MVNDAPAIWRVRVPFSNLEHGYSNCYFICSQGEWGIIDPGAYSLAGREAFIDTVCALGVDFSRCVVFLTHMHFDHAEMARYMLPARTPVYAMRCGVEARMPSAQEALRRSVVRFMAAFGASAEDAFSYAACDAETAFLDPDVFNVRYVSHGDSLRIGAMTFRTVATPGHTLDHMCLAAEEGGVVFGGDMVCEGLTPAIDLPRDGRDMFAAFDGSLSCVDALQPRLLLPGHNDLLTRDETHERIDELRAKKHAKLDLFLNAVHDCEFGTGDDIARAFSGDDYASWHSRSAMSRYYIMLEAAVMVRHLEEEGRIERVFDSYCSVYRYRSC